MELSTGRAREKGNTFSVCNHVSGCVDITDLAQNVRQKRKSGQNVLFKAVKKAVVLVQDKGFSGKHG